MIIIDRFEENYAVLETDEGMIDVERELISQDSHEGDVLVYENGIYITDISATETRKAEMREKFRKLRRNGND
jgi:hypothetical protein